MLLSNTELSSHPFLISVEERWEVLEALGVVGPAFLSRTEKAKPKQRRREKYSLASAMPKGRCFVLIKWDKPLSHFICPNLFLSSSCLPQQQLCSPARYKNIIKEIEMMERVFFLAARRSGRAGLGAGRGFCSGYQIPSSGCEARCRRLSTRERGAPPLPNGAARGPSCAVPGSPGHETERGRGGTQGRAVC